MAIVFKDFTKDVHRIDQIPIQNLDNIKQWLATLDIKYYEGKANLNWKPLLKQIREDPDEWLVSGGWEFLNNEIDDDEDEDGGGLESESDFEPSDSEDESESDEESDTESLVDSAEDDVSDDDDNEDDDDDDDNRSDNKIKRNGEKKKDNRGVNGI